MSLLRTPAATLGWLSIVRLGLVQTSLGAIVVLAISTLNRVMVVEYALPASVPGALVALHYVVQMLRPRLGHGSDVGGRRTRWIVGGMALLAAGGIIAALGTAQLGTSRPLGLTLAVLGYVLIGLGAGAAGTSLLVVVAKEVAPERRAAAATVLWIMMIAGFAITSGVVAHHLDPFTPWRLVSVVGCANAIAFVVALGAVYGVEGSTARGQAAGEARPATPSLPFRTVLGQVWTEQRTRRFAIFVLVSMLAYSAEELLLEPFGGVVFSLTPGGTAHLSGAMHGGSVLGMILVAVGCTGLRLGTPRRWVTVGCVASAVALGLVGAAGIAGPAWPIVPAVFTLGLANGAFAVAAIGSMMELAGLARDGREGVRMGLWGGAQAVAFAAGGLAGTASVDLMRQLVATPALAYLFVFAVQAALFLAAARIAQAPDTDSATRESAAGLRALETVPASAFRGDTP